VVLSIVPLTIGLAGAQLATKVFIPNIVLIFIGGTSSLLTSLGVHPDDILRAVDTLTF